MRKSQKSKEVISSVAIERIALLLSYAKAALLGGNENLSRRYVSIAMRITRHYNIRIKERKKEFCKRCLLPMVPGVSSSIRLSSTSDFIVVKCTSCGSERHIFYAGNAIGVQKG
ncbi:ribonuclease P Rpr2/Rpp21/SNM1 subunit [Candidatus Marsarchaeota archaeon]|nr:ribonuclease P Rpr2/Rpp21/SNM1 subunit [Candidatus Marsarchaeota archaeon]MCL5404798.1 ribonuclease P Rpr2/Rpp21/SNM1 subunit [Candidatus Marsarchaeota archaeon]